MNVFVHSAKTFSIYLILAETHSISENDEVAVNLAAMARKSLQLALKPDKISNLGKISSKVAPQATEVQPSTQISTQFALPTKPYLNKTAQQKRRNEKSELSLSIWALV